MAVIQCLCCEGGNFDGSARVTKKVAATLAFKREELLYDIKNLAWIEGHVMDEASQHNRHTLEDIGEDGNVDRVTRILDVVHAAAVEMLYPYTKIDVEGGEYLDDRLEEPERYYIEMQVPVTMSQTTLLLIEKLVHEFMVYRVLHDWLGITNPAAADKWLLKAEEAVAKINELKHLRTGVLTRPSHPW